MAATRFVVPTPRITGAAAFAAWKTSETYEALRKFVLQLNDAVRGQPLPTASAAPPPPAAVARACAALEQLEALLADVPPTSQPTRFGNQAFRTFFDRATGMAEALCESVLARGGPELHGAVAEVAPYLLGALGNQQRIDYGTGHEASFLMWMYVLRQLGVFEATRTTDAALVLVLFARYLRLCRAIQQQYQLEPAGTRGVWGLDDYQFLPFVWGAAQLVGHDLIQPKSIHDAALVEAHAEEYLYLAAIRYISVCKKGPFGEHSPYLNDISYVPHQLWSKVNNGMLKIYQLEVMEKFPVVQHFLFGSLLPFSPGAPAPP